MSRDRIPAHEIRRHPSYDPNGYLFEWRGEILRAILPARRHFLQELWNSGLIQELIERDLFPATELTEWTTDDADLVFRHARIPVVTHPDEWSFEMLRDAALTTLEVNRIARRHGYQTLDAHGFNILFHHHRPLFVDLGSFVPIHDDFHCRWPGWRPWGEFQRSFVAPLRMWSAGDAFLARHALHGDQLPLANYWRWRWRLARLLPLSTLNRFEFLLTRYRALNTVPLADFRRLASVSDRRARLAERVIEFSRRWGLPFSAVDLDRLRHRVRAIRPPRANSAWADYHRDARPDARQAHVIELVRRHKPRTVLDMAGNAGFFARAIAAATDVDHVICADYDSNAIDHLYRALRHGEERVQPVVLNLALSIGDTRFPLPEKRLASDMVLALALSHHLLLTQNLTIDFILHRLKRFTRRLLVIEFMPLGLYSAQFGRVPEVPDWYHIDWFRDAFARHFEPLEESHLDTNRVLFVGQSRD